METVNAIFTTPGIGASPSPPGPAPQAAAPARPEVYAAGRARCPRCRIEYLYDPVLYPWCPGCCDRPDDPDKEHRG